MPARALVAARAVSSLGDSLGLVALLLYLADGTGQAFAVAALLLVGDFAPALLGPLTGVLADRFDRRRVMIVCELVQAAAVAVIAVTLPALPVPALLALVAMRAIAAQVFLPASRAAVPALVTDDRLERVNSALGFGTNGMEALGPFVAAALLPLIGVRGVLAVDVATFVISALALALLPRLAPVPRDRRQGPAFLADARAGLGYVLREPLVRAVVIGFVAVVACNGVDDVALVFLATDSLAADQPAVALLYGAVGVGLLAGYAVLAGRSGRAPLPVLLIGGFAVSSLGNLLTGLAWAVGAAFGLQLVRGLGLAAMDVGSNTLLQRRVPAHLVGRVFGNLYGGVGVAAAASYLLGALLLELTGPRTTFVVAGSAGLLVTAGTLAVVVKISRSTSRRGGPDSGPRPPAA